MSHTIFCILIACVPLLTGQEVNIRTVLPLDIRLCIVEKLIDSSAHDEIPQQKGLETVETICTLLGPDRTGFPVSLLNQLFKKPQLFNYSAETLQLFLQTRRKLGICKELADELLEHKCTFFYNTPTPIHLLFPGEKMIPDLYGSIRNYYFFDTLQDVCAKKPHLIHYNSDNIVKIFPAITDPEHSSLHQKLKKVVEINKQFKRVLKKTNSNDSAEKDQAIATVYEHCKQEPFLYFGVKNRRGHKIIHFKHIITSTTTKQELLLLFKHKLHTIIDCDRLNWLAVALLQNNKACLELHKQYPPKKITKFSYLVVKALEKAISTSDQKKVKTIVSCLFNDNYMDRGQSTSILHYLFTFTIKQSAPCMAKILLENGARPLPKEIQHPLLAKALTLVSNETLHRLAHDILYYDTSEQPDSALSILIQRNYFTLENIMDALISLKMYANTQGIKKILSIEDPEIHAITHDYFCRTDLDE